MTVRATIEILEAGISRVAAVPRAGLTLGRAPDQGVVLRSPSVSAHHAQLYWQGDDLFLRDAGSSYGTRREGQPIQASVRLADGDEVVLGGAAVVRVSLFGDGFGAPVSALAEPGPGVLATEAPGSAQPFAIDLLPMVEALYQAQTEQDLDRRVAAAAATHLAGSRVALIELEGTGQRFRALAAQGVGAPDASFVSRTVIAEAARRGVAHYSEAVQKARPLMSMVRSGASSAIAAGIRPHDGRVRVLYLDTFLDAPPLTWGHALTLQLFAAHVAGAYDALRARILLLEDQRRFEQLRRYFSPAVAEHLLKGQLELIEKPRQLHATVLFADLVGYTAMSERLRGDPERLLALLNRWLDAGARAVIGHGGTLDKFIGDAVMAVFGAPFPAPEGELFAVRCALEMREAIAAIGRETGEHLQITVGINSGEVVAGSVGSRRRLEYTVLGDTVNVASRLQGRASPGEILVGEATAARLRDDVELEDAGELTLKNHGAVRAYRVARLRA
jgi:adenylate cyclase